MEVAWMYSSHKAAFGGGKRNVSEIAYGTRFDLVIEPVSRMNCYGRGRVWGRTPPVDAGSPLNRMRAAGDTVQFQPWVHDDQDVEQNGR